MASLLEDRQTFQDLRVRIEDQGSLNGTYVNRQRIETAPLGDGDEIQIGKFRFVFLVGVETGR